VSKMPKHSPEKLCNNSVFKYLLPRKLLAAAKRQVLQTLEHQTVIFQEHNLSDDTVELYVIAVALTASQQQALTDLQHNEVLIQRIARADFSANQLQFGEQA
jgi:hypothetical protein